MKSLPPLKRTLRDVFRIEPLEARVLLSADPVLGAAQIVLQPAQPDPAAVLAEAYAAPADIKVATSPNATVLVTDQGAQAAASPDWLLVDTSQLTGGNGRVVVGGADSNAVIHVGTADATLQLGDLVLVNPQAGGEIHLDGSLVLGGSLIIQGSGHTTTISADQTAADDLQFTDSVLVVGNRSLTAGTDGTGSIQLASSGFTVNGNGDSTADTLTVRAPDNIRFAGVVGGNDALEGLTIGGVTVGGVDNLPDNVTFDREVTVNGDLIINSSGTVTFSAKVVLTSGGDLRITGASNVVFAGGLELQGTDSGGVAGDIFIDANEIDFSGGSESIKGAGLLTLRPSTVTFGVDVGSVPNSAAQPTGSTLNLTTDDLKALADGFSRIVIGQQDGLHANALAGSVRIGAIDALSQPTTRDPLEVYGGTISVEDLSNPDYTFLVQGTIRLDAHSDITIANTMEANAGAGVLDVTLYSDIGKVQQLDSAADPVLSEPLRAATLTVHAATGIALPFTEIASVSAVNVTSGGLSIVETAAGGDVTLTLLSQQATSAGISLTTTNGNITVNGTGVANAGNGLTQLVANTTGSGKNITVNQDIHSAAGAISLTASGAIQTFDDPGIVTHGVIATDGAANVTLLASGGAIAQGADIRSAGGLLSLDASLGVSMLDGVRATSQNGTGAVSLRARGGNVSVSIIEAAAAITLNASQAIIDGLTGNNPNLDGETAAVLLAAASGIGSSSTPLQTRVNSLSATNSTTGGLYVREATGLRLASAGTFAVDLGGSDGTMAVYTVDGAITVEKTVRSTGTIGNMVLQTGELAEGTAAGIDVRADVTSAHGSMTVKSVDGITVDNLAAGAPTLSVTAATRTLDIEADDSIATEGDARFATVGGNVYLAAAAGSVTLGIADAGTGTVGVFAGGSISDAQADDGNATPAANIIGAAAQLVAGGAIGGAGVLLETQVATLAARATTGAIFVSERDAVAVTTVAGATVNRIDTAGAVSGVAVVQTVGITAGQAVVLQTGGNLSVDQALGAGGNVRIAAGGTLNVATTIATTAGALSATAAGAFTVTAAGSLASTASMDLQSTGGAVSMANGAFAQTNSATLRVQAAGDVTVGLLDARSAADRPGNTHVDALTWGAVSVVAGGNILDNAGETATDVYGYTVRLQAVGGIGAGTEQLETEAGQMSASAGAAGLFLTEASGLEVQQLAALTVQRVGLDGVAVAGPTDAAQGGLASGGVLSVQTQTGAILVGSSAAVSAAGNLLLDARTSGLDVTLSSAVTSSGGSISVLSGRDLFLGANVGTAAAGQTVDLFAQGTVLQAQGTAITSNGGNVSVEAVTGSFTLETIAAGSGGVWVSAAGLVDGDGPGDSEVDITAASAQLFATGGIGAGGAALETQVATLTASAGTGLFVTESDGVTVGRLQLNVSRIAANGSAASTAHAGQEDLGAATVVVRTLTGDLTVNAGSATPTGVNGGSGNVRLEAVAGNVVLAANVNAGSGNASVLGAAGVSFQGTGAVTTTGGTVDVEATGGAVTMADGTQVLSGGGAIRLAASGDVTVGSLDAGAGNASIFAGGGILDNAGETTTDVRAGALRLQAAAGIGSGTEALETDVAQLSAAAGAAGMFLAEANAVTVTQTAAISVNRVGTDGTTLTAQTDAAQAGLASGGALVLQTVAGTLATTGQGGITAAGNVFLKADGTTSNLTIGAAVASSGGSMTLYGAQDTLLNANLSTATAGKSISAGAGRDLTQAQGASIATSNGGITVSATGTATIELLSAGTAGIDVSSNRLLDGDAPGDAEVDIVAGGAWLLGLAGIGAAGAELETSVDVLRASGNASGLFITETDAVSLDLVSVAFQIVDATGAATNATTGGDRGLSGGDVVLRTLNGAVSSNVNTAVAAGGNLLLQAGGSTGDLTLNGTTTAAGAMSLLAGRDVTLTKTVSTTTAGSSIDIQAAGRIDAQQLSAISANNGNVQLLALAGSVTLESVAAGTGTVRISGTSIVDGDTAAAETEVDITAGQLLLTATSAAGTGVNPLETTVGTLSVSAGGIVGIVESDALTLGSVTSSVDRVGSAGTTSATAPVTQGNVSGTTVTIRTLAGSLAAAATGGTVTATGNLLLKATGASSDITLASAASSSTGNISIDAGRDLSVAGAITTSGANKTVDLRAGGKLEQLQGSTLTTNNGHVSMVATGVLTIETITAGVGRVNLTGSSVVDGDTTPGDTEIDVNAAGVRATATAGGIGSAANPLETAIATLSAVASGDVFVTDATGGLDLAGVATTINRVGNTGADSVVSLVQNNVSGATVVIRTLAGNLTNQSDGTVTATGNLLLQAGGSTSDLILAGAVTSSGGHVSLAAGEDILLNTNVSATAAGKSLDLVAGRNFVQAQTTTATTADGNLALLAGGTAAIETFNAGAGQVRIAAASVTDGDVASNETEVDILASSLQLVTTGAVGLSANALETTVQTLAASAGGNLFITESDALTIAGLTIDTQRVAADGTSAATANATTSGLAAATAVLQAKAGSIDSLAAAAVNTTGGLLLKALGATSDILLRGNASAGGNLTLDAGQDLLLGGVVAATGSGRSVVLQAGRNFTQSQGGSITANDGSIVVAATGDATLESLAAGTGAVRLAAASVIDGDGPADTEVDIAGGALAIVTPGAIGASGSALETSVGTLALQAGGVAYLTESDALTLGTVTVAAQRVGTDGSNQSVPLADVAGITGGSVVVLQAAGSITGNAVGGAISAAGNLLVATSGASSDLTLNGTVASTAGDVSLSAARDLLVNANVSTTGAGNTIDLAAQRNFVQAQDTAVTTTDGNIAVAAGTGGATIESLVAGTGGVWIQAAAIVDGDAAGDSEVDITAAAAQLNAAAIGSSLAHIETRVATLAARSGNGLFITEADALSVDSVTVDVRRVGADGTSTATAHATDNSLVGVTVVLRTVDGALATQGAVTATGNLLLQAGGANGDLTVAGGLSALGATSLAAGRNLVLTSNVGSNGSTLDVSAAGTITATEGTTLSSSNGNLLLQAGGAVTVDTVNAGTGSLRIVGASLIDGDTGAGETEVDLLAAQLQLSVTGAIGAAGNPIETTVTTLAASAGGAIRIAESDGLQVDAVSFGGVNRVGSDGGATATGPTALANVAAGGDVALAAAGSLGVADQASVSTSAGSLALAAGSTLTLGNQSTVTGADGAVSLTAQGNLALGTSSLVSSTTGAVTLSTQGTLALAGQADVRSGGGNIVFTAQGDITMAANADAVTTGAATIDLTSATGKVTMDPNLSTLSTGSGDIHVTAEGDIQPGALLTAGKAFLDARNGSILIRGNLQRNGEDVDLFGDDLVIDVPVASPGGTLRIGPLDPGATIVIGDLTPTGPALHVDTTELARLQDGFAQIVIGSSLANQTLLLDGVTSPLVFHDPLLLTSTGAGGTVAVQGSLTGDSLTIADSGDHTTFTAATVSMQGSVLVQDQLTVTGANTIAAGQGGSGSLHFTQAITGAGGAADTLALSANGGSIALDQAVSNLDGLTISQASNVTFGAAVSLTGDLVIEATGVVTFNGPLTLASGAHLIVRGGGSVVFNAGADLGTGDALLQVAAIAATGGAGSLHGQGLLQVQGTTSTQGIHVGAGGAAGELVVGDDVLRAVGTGFRALQIGSGATAAAGAITVGDADLSVTGSPVQVLGSTIAVATTATGVRFDTALTLHAAGAITATGRVLATTTAALSVTSDTGAVTMAAGSLFTSQGGHVALQAATGLAVAGIDARGAGLATVSLQTASGQITDANADAAVDVFAQGVDFSGRGTALGSAAVLEVSAPVVRVDPAGGLVLRESGTDGRVYFNVLRGGDLEQVLVAVGASQRITADPDAFIAGGGLQQLPVARTTVSSLLSLSLAASSSLPSSTSQVQSYLSSVPAVAGSTMEISQRLLAESELSFASGQLVGDGTGVDYWSENLSL